MTSLSLQSGNQVIENNQIIFNGQTYYVFYLSQQLISQYSVAIQYTQNGDNVAPPGTNQMIISNTIGDNGISFMFGYFNDTNVAEPGYYVGNYSSQFNLVGPIPIVSNVPANIVITFASGTLNVYLNDTLTNTGSIPPVNNNNQYYLGRQWYDGALIMGKVKYVSMYTRVLTPVEITFLYSGFDPNPPICFLEDAPVLTPDGYKPISSLRKGDHILTPQGASVPIQEIKIRNTIPHSSVNPLVIPKGMYGATEALPISPEHKVLADGKMTEAKYLGLVRMMMLMPFDYYNLELPDYEQMVVAGVTVESLYPIMRIAISGDEFKKLIHSKYGSTVTQQQLAMINKKIRYLDDGRVEVPVDKRLHLKERTLIDS
jgi:hypothetical protein